MAPSTKPGWIEWRDCVPKHIIMEDLETGVLPDNEEELSAAEAWSICYQHMAEFVTAGVVFDQFKERLRDHRKQIRDQNVGIILLSANRLITSDTDVFDKLVQD
jgi:hypothetical protein